MSGSRFITASAAICVQELQLFSTYLRVELIINLKAAKQIGLTIPPNVLARADRVIQ